MNKQKIKELFPLVKDQNPLVHHITNTVTINDCANVTLAIGGSPVMATSMEEVADMARLADALVINFGTIDDLMYEAMIRAGQAANEKGIPVIFDPVGVGATPFRTKRAKDFIERVKVSIVRGNASEVHALIGGEVHTRGVDSGVVTLSSQEITLLAAKQLNAIAVISGKQDYVSDGNEMIGIDNGDIWLTKITGTGCTTASLVASFAGVTNDLLLAAVAGMSTMSLAGELAKKRLALEDGLGTYRVNLMDELSLMNGERWEVGVRLI